MSEVRTIPATHQASDRCLDSLSTGAKLLLGYMDPGRQCRASRLLLAGAGSPCGWTEEERRYVEGED